MVEETSHGQLYAIYIPDNDAYLDLMDDDDGKCHLGENDGTTLLLSAPELEYIRDEFRNGVDMHDTKSITYQYIFNMYKPSAINNMQAVPVRAWIYKEQVPLDAMVPWDVVESVHIEPYFLGGEFLVEDKLDEGDRCG